MHKSQTPLILSAALAAAFAASTAFAQDAAAQQQKTPPPQDTTQAPKSDAPAKKSWSELDTDGNGSLSVSEAAAMESLSKVFAQADADGNGELTQEEYKAWLASSGTSDKDVPKQ